MDLTKETIRSNERSATSDQESPDISKTDRLIVVLLTVVISVLLFRPLVANFNVWRGDQYAHAGQVNEAARAYRKAILLDADNVGAHDGLGFTFEAQGQFDKAIDEYEKAVALAPDEAFYHYILGISLLRLKKYRSALGPLREAARLEPNKFTHLRALASVYRSLGQERRAREVLVVLDERFNIESDVKVPPGLKKRRQ